MSKMHYFSLKSPLQRPLIFDFGNLKLRDLAKLWFFKLIMKNTNLKKSVMTSSFLRHQKCHQTKVTRLFNFGLLLIKFLATPIHSIEYKLTGKRPLRSSSQAATCLGRKYIIRSPLILPFL